MNKLENFKRASIQTLQSTIFISNLQKEMNKMRKDCKSDKMIKDAKNYLEEGMTKAETQELLKLDGYDHDLVNSYMDNLDEEDMVTASSGPKWGFDFEDTRGKIYASSEFNIVVTANNAEEAWSKAEEEVEKISRLQTDKVIEVYKIA